MNERNFDEELDALLEELINSEDSGQKLLSRIADRDPELAALLQTAAHIRGGLRPGGPDPVFARNAEVRIVNRMRATRRRAVSKPKPRPSSGWFGLPRFAQALAAALLVVVLIAAGTVGTAAAAENALPGDTLYPFKRGLEQARLVLSFSDQGDLRLLGQFSDERLDEIEALLGSGRHQDLDLAIAEYVETLARYEQAGTDNETQAVDPSVDEKLMQHVQILQLVKDQVPVQAQSAIEQVLEIQLQHMGDGPPGNQTPGMPPNAGPEQDDQPGQGPAIQDEILAEQIAGQFEVEVDEVQAIFGGQCDGDWQCVREYFLEQHGPPEGLPIPPNVPGPGGGKPD